MTKYFPLPPLPSTPLVRQGLHLVRLPQGRCCRARFRLREAFQGRQAQPVRHSRLHLRYHRMRSSPSVTPQGNPKGVMCSHDSCTFNVKGMKDRLGFKDGDRFVCVVSAA